MKWKWVSAVCLSVIGLVSGGHAVWAQCAENNYIHDGAPSAMLDCQPFAALKLVPADQMSEMDRNLVADRHAELEQAARFYGFDLDAPGWSYQQGMSSLLHKHVLLIFTNATPATRASHFSAVLPAQVGAEKVQVVPEFGHGLRPYQPGWQAKGSYAVFNRLLNSERGERPITQQSDWTDYAVLYLTLVGRVPAVPTETDSLKANWDLSVKRATTPVILVAKDGSAVIAFSDLSEDKQSVSWKLIFNKQGQILKAERNARGPADLKYIQTLDQTAARQH